MDPLVNNQTNKTEHHFQQMREMLESLEKVWVQGEEMCCISAVTQTALQDLVEETLRDYQKLNRQSARLVKLGDLQQEAIAVANKALAQNQQSLEQQNLALRTAAELREDVDRIMRHDLKTPLNAIIGLSDILSYTLVMDAIVGNHFGPSCKTAQQGSAQLEHRSVCLLFPAIYSTRYLLICRKQ